MAILVKNQTVENLLKYLQLQPESDIEANELYEALLEDQVESEITDLKADGEYPKPTKSGAWIV